MPDLVEQCPLPELAEALGPYIRSREEVNKIRRGIDSLLTQFVHDENVPISKATLSVAETSAQSAINIPFNGVRRAFMQALIARQKAQSQYDALKAELGLLQSPVDKRETTKMKDSPVADTVALIRQRQRRDKLLVIDKALDNLEKARHSSRYADPSELLNGMQAQIPPPHTQQSQDESLAEAQSHIFELQKAVLRAQSNIQSKPHINHAKDTNLEDWKRAYALRRARDDLIAWIEGELAKLSEDEDHTDPDLEITADTGAEESLEDIKTTLQNPYDKYINSRQHLLRVLSPDSQAKPGGIEPVPDGQQSANSDAQSSNTGLASRILPFIEILRSTAQDEAALMQHTSYLRRQVTAVSAETEQLLVRLSDESHMVRPGTSHTASWAEAAKNARIRDADIVNPHLDIGETSIGSVREILASAQMSSLAFEPITPNSVVQTNSVSSRAYVEVKLKAQNSPEV
ncbi:hypothetical protein E4T38_05040 [Aureobasidium subglaciale]|nr:hypothetical protein E4T38_05040 [Aureobasidium subglaciale]KAI5222197.1 hypothetical protein E4T40_05078 [Aureobasidium subglaciale]KAI5226311.1 hypothetical protein E4T41_04897 [Aureobasidium subglaciale]KAI5262073.1 hypothetical protein E4T46_04790 [Aureobasidium subglaciale]